MASWQTSNINSIFVGTIPNDGTGNDLRTSFVKVDTNFANLTAFLNGTSVDFPSANVTAANVVANSALYSSAIFNSGNIQTTGINTTGPSTLGSTKVSQLTVVGPVYANGGILLSGSIAPTANVAYDLGSPNNYFRNLYIQGAVAVNTVQSSSNASILEINANVLPGDTRDVGVIGKYNQSSSNSYAFFGQQHATNNFIYKLTPTDASQGSGIVSDGVYGTAQFGSLVLSNTTAATNSTTGALQVAGGASILGNLYVAGNTVSSSSVATTYYGNVVATVANISRSTMANIAGNVWVDGIISSAGSPVVTINTIAASIVGQGGTLLNTTIFGGPVITFIGATPSTSTATGTIVIPNGGGIGVSGNINAGGIVGPYYGLLQTPNQTNITGLGTLAALNVTGTGTFNTVQATSVGTASLTASGNINSTGGFYGTVQTAAQPNITSIGALTGLSVTGTATVGNIVTTNGIFWANGQAFVPSTSGGGNYGNLDVAAFLPVYSGNVAALTVTGNLRTYGNIITTNGIYWANGTAYSSGSVGGSNYSNANVASYLPTYLGNIGSHGVAGNLTVYGNIVTANGVFYPNGSPYSSGSGSASITYQTYTSSNNTITTSANITTTGNIVGGGVRSTTSTSAPSNPTVGDIWYNSTTDQVARYTYDGVGSYWLDITGPTTANLTTPTFSNISATDIYGTLHGNLAPAVNGNIYITGNLIPNANVSYDLGSSTNWFRDLWLSAGTIHIGGAKISQDTATGSIAIIPAPTQSVPNPVATVISSAGGVSTVQTTAGKVTAAQINAVVTQAEQIAANNVNASSSTFGNVNTSGDVVIGGNLTVTGNIVAPNAMVYRGADQLSWDNITLMGTYLVNRNSWAGTTGTPLNSQVFTGTLEVNASGTSITQNYRPYDGSANPSVFWTRSQFNAGSWSGWVELTNNAEITDGGSF